MKARYVFLLVATLAMGCGGSDTPTSPSRPGGGGGDVVAGPTIVCPANISASTTTSTAQVAFPAPTVSGGLAPVTVSCTPASGATFQLGSTNVSCTATDSLSRQAVCGFSVNVTRIPTLQRTSFLAFGDSVTAGEVSVPTSLGARRSTGSRLSSWSWFPAHRIRRSCRRCSARATSRSRPPSAS